MKTKNLIIILCSLFVLIGCTTYSRISLSGSDFYGRNKVIKNIDRYDVYVHQADSVYELVDPEALDSGRIKGTLKSLEAKDIPKKTVVNNDDKLRPGEQNDIHIYIDNEVEETTDLKPADQITLDEKNVENVKMTASESSGALGVLGIVLLSILLLLVAGIIIILVAVASASDGSGSESDSGSGGSDSGGSDSGCYIATMAYGSYEAPKVMTLRRFRDQFLQKYGWGRSFIQWYYRNSPGFVEKHQSKKWLHVTLKGGLDVFVFILKPFFK